MGDPKFSRKQYSTPAHPWRITRIEEENEILHKYGLVNKQEVWRALGTLRSFRGQARELQARLRTGEAQAQKETKQLVARLSRLGVLADTATLDDVLALDINAILGRRFQTLLYQKGLAHTPKQARQFIVHGHASIKGRKITIPGYLVPKAEEGEIGFYTLSPIASDMHPMRLKPEQKAIMDKQAAAEKEADAAAAEAVPAEGAKAPDAAGSAAPKDAVKEQPKEGVKEAPKEEKKDALTHQDAAKKEDHKHAKPEHQKTDAKAEAPKDAPKEKHDAAKDHKHAKPEHQKTDAKKDDKKEAV